MNYTDELAIENDRMVSENEQIAHFLDMGVSGDYDILAAHGILRGKDIIEARKEKYRITAKERYIRLKAENKRLRQRLLEAIEEAYPTAT